LGFYILSLFLRLSLYIPLCPYVHLFVNTRACHCLITCLSVHLSACPRVMHIFSVHTFYPLVLLLVCLSVYLPVRLYICSSIHSSVLCLSICTYLCLFIYLAVHLSVCPSICLFIYLSVHLSVYPSINRSVQLPVHLSVCLFNCLSISPTTTFCLSILLYMISLFLCSRKIFQQSLNRVA
jgi:hypothetical protein